MGNKIFTTIVFLLWGTTMSWLVSAKILPSFWQGEPPRTGLNAREPVCWKVKVGEQQIGWAVSQAVAGAEETVELHSRVRLNEVPFDRMAPRWMASLVNKIGPLKVDMRSRTVLDTLGNLSLFDTTVQINDLPSAIRMTGRVDDGNIRLRLQYGEVVHRLDYPWPEHAMFGGELVPDASLLQIYKGRTWQKEIYNPFGGPKGAIELVKAEVVDEEPLLLDGKLTNTRRIEYSSLDSAGVSANNRRRATLWVAEDGRVLRQEISLMDVQLRFDRESDDFAQTIAAELLELDRFATLGEPEVPPRKFRSRRHGGAP